eukprot:2560358-Alexandrium_andersonii.AAC.1
MDHSYRGAASSRRNPVFSWCFADEDFIGRVKRIGAQCHVNRLGWRVLERWAMRYFAQLRMAE